VGCSLCFKIKHRKPSHTFDGLEAARRVFEAAKTPQLVGVDPGDVSIFTAASLQVLPPAAAEEEPTASPQHSGLGQWRLQQQQQPTLMHHLGGERCMQT
jgi:hypothetical protein